MLALETHEFSLGRMSQDAPLDSLWLGNDKIRRVEGRHDPPTAFPYLQSRLRVMRAALDLLHDLMHQLNGLLHLLLACLEVPG